jgi:hypothetical protein
MLAIKVANVRRRESNIHRRQLHMEYLLPALKLVVSLGILNVWILRRDQRTAYRGQAAQTLREEFAVYGLSAFVYYLVGICKVALALALLVSLWVPGIGQYVAGALGALMLVAFGMHLKVKDAAIKSAPSLAVLAMCVGIILL